MILAKQVPAYVLARSQGPLWRERVAVNIAFGA
jgi:hypothetical protein